MSDETEMNPELESFAASLRDKGAPEIQIDRDQLMYDAGWAAAQAQSSAVATNRTNGFRTAALSFASGLAVAAAVMFSIVPFPVVAPSNSGTEIATATPNQTQPPAEVEVAASERVDLIAWVENLPPGHSITNGFSSRPTSPDLTVTQVSFTKPIESHEPTTQRLMRELLPTVRPKRMTPNWAAWLTPGT